MAGVLEIPIKLGGVLWGNVKQAPPTLLLLAFVTTVISGFVFFYLVLFLIAPIPRPPHPSEKKYITTTADGKVTAPKPLSCWHDEWLRHRAQSENAGDFTDKDTGHIEDAEVFMSVVIPAYNEEARLETMLEEAVAYLDSQYGRSPPTASAKTTSLPNGTAPASKRGATGYEILLVNDGSSDATVDVALAFSHRNNLHDILRIVTLKQNRGKGGAVTHGLRHVRGHYAVFADADGASKFSDLGSLVTGCDLIKDAPGRCIAVGSRAHLVGSEAVVKRSFVRNALMHSFHVLLRLLTPPATSRIGDTQCGFKLFSRAALPHIVPYMHAEGWIFDVEMLMLAESAPGAEAQLGDAAKGIKVRGPGIRVAEVPVGWKEVGGSKLNVVWDSVGMAWGLAVLRAGWAVGVYRRR